MGLIKKRPDIGLMAPRQIAVGDRFEVEVVVDCPAAVPVNAIEVHAIGFINYVSGSQYGDAHSAREFCRGTVTPVADRIELEPGEHRYRGKFRLPSSAPGSYAGRYLKIEYVLEVRVDIPWWPDARSKFLLTMIGSGGTPGAKQRVFVSALEGPKPGRPYVEVSLGSPDVEPGSTLRGAVALSNVAHNEYRAMVVSLVRIEKMDVGFGEHAQHVRQAHWRWAFNDPGENEPIPFTVRLPGHMVPGFELEGFSMQWFLEVVVDVAWSRDPTIWIPLNVLGMGVADTSTRKAPLAVGSDRLELVWRNVADSVGVGYADGVLHSQIGETRVEIRREHRGRAGVFLVAEVSYPDLGIALDTRGTGRRRELVGRDPTQVGWLLERIGEALDDRIPVEASDDHMVWEVADPGHRTAELGDLARHAVALADVLEAARHDIPAPKALAGQAGEWEQAALRLGGDLNRARMGIVAQRDGSRLELRTEWSTNGEPARTVLELRPDLPVDARHHLDWSARDGGDPPPSEIGLDAMADGVVEAMFVDGARLQLVLPAPLDNVDGAVARLEGLATVGARLSGRLGGYR